MPARPFQRASIEATQTLTLDTGGVGTTAALPCVGASAIVFGVSCNVNHQLTTVTFILTMLDGKQVTVSNPTAYQDGANIAVATMPRLRAAGSIITADLSTTTPRLTQIDSGDAGAVGRPIGHLYGIALVQLQITKAATAGAAIYSIFPAIYYS